MNYGAGIASEDMPYAEIVIPKPKDEKAIAEAYQDRDQGTSGYQYRTNGFYNELGVERTARR